VNLDLVSGREFLARDDADALLLPALLVWPEGGLTLEASAGPIYTLLGLDGCLVALFEQGGKLIGLDVVSLLGADPDAPLLQGHLTWIDPAHRGQGIWRRYVDQIVAACRAAGLSGFHFHSGLPFWHFAAPRLGFHVEPSIYDGITHWVREV